jgi:hypothetical protein
VSKFLGFLLGIAVALVGPAVFGVLAADGGIELNAKEMALAFGIGALIFWTVLSYFSGAAALGAALTFGAMIYAVNWIPNRTTNFLNDVPGVTTGMIDGIKQYTLNGVVPILAVISLIYAIQLIVQSVQARRRERAEADRRQREQEVAQAQQAAEVAAVYPVAGGDYPTSVDNRMGNNFGNTNYDDLFDEDPTPFPPRDPAEEQTAQYSVAEADVDRDDADDTVVADAEGNTEDETMLVPTDKDETVVVPAAGNEPAEQSADDDQQAAAQHQQTEEGASTRSAGEHLADAPTAAPTGEQGPAAQGAGGQAAGEGSADAAAADQAAPASGQPADEPAGPADGGATAGGQAPGEPTAGGENTGGQAPGQQPAGGGTAGGQVAGGPTVGGVGAGGPAGSGVGGSAEDETVVSDVPKGESAGAEDETVVGPASEVTPGESAGGVPEKEQRLERNEQVGQQYRERMDGPELEETGEFHFDAFENPNLPEEGRPQAPRIMDLPGQFRPAGA